MGPFAMTITGGIGYVYPKSIQFYSGYRIIRDLSTIAYNGGIRVILAELKLMDIPFFVLDLFLFGEYVPRVENPTSLLIRNETNHTDVFLANVTDVSKTCEKSQKALKEFKEFMKDAKK